MTGAGSGLKVLRAAERAAVAWKNGGGVTREVAAWPPGCDLGSFDWRVSIAGIRTAGPFSAFPGVERRMAVLEGSLSISIDGKSSTLSPESEPLIFAGEAPVFAGPAAGAVTDLNLMTRRGRFTGCLVRHLLREPVEATTPAGVTLLVAGGRVHVRCATLELELTALDAVLIDGVQHYRIVSLQGATHYHRVEITPWQTSATRSS